MPSIQKPPYLWALESTREQAQECAPSLGDRFGRIWTAATCWAMSAMFVISWWWPRALDNGRWVKLGVRMMVLEFILVHSGVLLGVVAARQGVERGRSLLRLAALYTIFGVVIALVFRSWEILASFAAVMSGRYWSACTARGAADVSASQRRAAASLALYVGLTFITVIIPVPRGGITPALLEEVWRTRGSGLWERHPEKALAMGSVYFLILGIIEARAPRRGGASARDGEARSGLFE